MAENKLTFTSVFYEDTYGAAKYRLARLRAIDKKYPEVKAYIIPVDGKFRVLRKVMIFTQKK